MIHKWLVIFSLCLCMHEVMQFYATHILCPEHYARVLWRDIGHKGLMTVTSVVVVVSGRVARPIPMTISTFLTEVAMVTIAMFATTCSRRRVGISFVH